MTYVIPASSSFPEQFRGLMRALSEGIAEETLDADSLRTKILAYNTVVETIGLGETHKIVEAH